MAATFVPRATFVLSSSLPRSYFLGHHKAGLDKMKAKISSVDLILECRDYRLPIASRNPLFESSLKNKKRIIVFTKRDLGSSNTARDKKREQILSKWHQPTNVVFSDHTNARDIKKILDIINKHQSDSLTGLTMMVVGMPNVGKSTLLNSLRRVSIGKSKAARTGGQPGITRKMGTSVKIIDSSGDSEGVYLLDTPGVFVPYVPDGETMLKLALCGSVKDSVVDLVTVADYLLYQINKLNPKIYSRYHSPTNDAQEFLARIARKTGRLGPGGEPELDGTAQWVINQWRKGKMGRFVMDDVTVDSLDEDTENVDNRKPSLNQAKKAYKQAHMDKVRTSGSSEQS